MKLIKKYLAATVFAVSALSAGSANAYLTNWTLDTNGAAAGGAVVVNEWLDLTGTAYIHNTLTSATTFTFQEAGVFTSFSHDGFGVLPSALTATFTGTGSGTLNGALTFATGTLEISSGATVIGTFDLTSGSGMLDGNFLPNGAVSTIFKATSLTAGYWFDSAMNDLANVVADPNGLLFGFATTNASLATNPSQIANGLALTGGLYAATFGSAPSTDNYGVENLVIGNNGQYRLQVPEPASLALIGVALLGLGASRRRKQCA